jgi:hypothetical protein
MLIDFSSLLLFCLFLCLPALRLSSTCSRSRLGGGRIPTDPPGANPVRSASARIRLVSSHNRPRGQHQHCTLPPAPSLSPFLFFTQIPDQSQIMYIAFTTFVSALFRSVFVCVCLFGSISGSSAVRSLPLFCFYLFSPVCLPWQSTYNVEIDTHGYGSSSGRRTTGGSVR